ncbi:MAG: helix-turn-helix domain-containing protein [Syntrophobacteraceae bacterium]
MANPKLIRVETVAPRLMSYQDAAKFLAISTKTLRNWISQNKFPEIRPSKLGGKPVFDLRKLERFCDALKGGGDGF